jgi:hypothetical protein
MLESEGAHIQGPHIERDLALALDVVQDVVYRRKEHHVLISAQPVRHQRLLHEEQQHVHPPRELLVDLLPLQSVLLDRTQHLGTHLG